MEMHHLEGRPVMGTPAQLVGLVRIGQEEVARVHVAGQPTAADVALLHCRRPLENPHDQGSATAGTMKLSWTAWRAKI